MALAKPYILEIAADKEMNFYCFIAGFPNANFCAKEFFRMANRLIG